MTKKPVKSNLPEHESLLIHPKRHPFYMDMTMGCDEHGNIMGVKATVVSDTGAYASLGGPVLERAARMRQDHIIMKILISKGLHIIPIIHRPERSGDLALHRPVLQQRRC